MRTLAALAVLVLVAACQAAPGKMTDEELAAYEAEVEQAINDRWDTWERTASVMDYESWLPFWTADPWLLRSGRNLRGSDLRTVAGEFFGSGQQDYSLHVESFEVFVHGDVAYQVGQLDEGVRMPGEERMETREYFFARWRKEEGVWKIDRFLAAPRDAPPEG